MLVCHHWGFDTAPAPGVGAWVGGSAAAVWRRQQGRQQWQGRQATVLVVVMVLLQLRPCRQGVVRPEAAVLAATAAAATASPAQFTWSCMRDSRGHTTTVTPGRSTAGSCNRSNRGTSSSRSRVGDNCKSGRVSTATCVCALHVSLAVPRFPCRLSPQPYTYPYKHITLP